MKKNKDLKEMVGMPVIVSFDGILREGIIISAINYISVKGYSVIVRLENPIMINGEGVFAKNFIVEADTETTQIEEVSEHYERILREGKKLAIDSQLKVYVYKGLFGGLYLSTSEKVTFQSFNTKVAPYATIFPNGVVKVE